MRIIISSCLIIFSLILNAQSGKLTVEPYMFMNGEGDSILAEMGNFQVLEKRSNAESRKLNLKFVRFKSTNPNPGSPIVYLAGGPGGSGIGTARGSRYDLFLKMREIGDVIAFDQRGTGISDGLPPYKGMWMAPLDKPLDEAEIKDHIAEETLKMEAFFVDQGCDPTGYNSNESADDINDLRLALGVDKISIWGISYGSHLALTTLKRHESKIDKVIIAGVEGYDDTVKLPSDQQELLEKIDELAKPDFPDFLGDVKKLLTNLEENPVEVLSKNPLNGEDVSVVLGRLDLQILISWYLGGPDNFKSLPLDIQNMLKGDFSSIAPYAIYTKIGQYNGMSTCTDIASGISKERRARIEREVGETLIGDAINFPYLIQRDALAHMDLGQDFRAPFESEVPVLCISGTLDGRTAVKNADFALKSLINGRHLVIEGAGHSDPLFLSSPKIAETMLSFMKGEDVGNPRIVLDPLVFDKTVK